MKRVLPPGAYNLDEEQQTLTHQKINVRRMLYFLQLQQDTMRSLSSEQSVSVKDEVMEEKNGTGFIHSTNSFLLCHTLYETAAKSKRHFLF